jgi:hypothetical protein
MHLVTPIEIATVVYLTPHLALLTTHQREIKKFLKISIYVQLIHPVNGINLTQWTIWMCFTLLHFIVNKELIK